MLVRRRDATASLWVFHSAHHKGPLSWSTVSHQHTVRRRLLKIADGFVINSLRHTMLTWIGASGADAFTIKRIAGHSSVTVSEKYIHPTPESLELAFQRFVALGEPVPAEGLEERKLLGPATVPATVAGASDVGILQPV
jgi:integrase